MMNLCPFTSNSSSSLITSKDCLFAVFIDSHLFFVPSSSELFSIAGGKILSILFINSPATTWYDSFLFFIINSSFLSSIFGSGHLLANSCDSFLFAISVDSLFSTRWFCICYFY